MMRHRFLRLGLPLALTLLALPLRAQDVTTDDEGEARFRLMVNGSYNPTGITFSEGRSFEQFLEQASSNRDYDGGKGFVFEAGGIFSITRSLGFGGSIELFSGTHDGQFREALPHPLYFDRPRSLEGEVTGLAYDERAIHLDVVFSGGSGAFTFDLFGGPTFFFTSTELVGDVVSSSSFPFDEVSLVRTETSKLDDNPVGFNLGGALTYNFTSRVGVAFQARFSRGRVELQPEGGSLIELDAGGFRAGVGLRLTLF